MEFIGKVTHALTPKNGVSARTGNPWKSQEFRIEEEGMRFPNSLVAKVFGEDKINEFNLQVGKSYIFQLDFHTNESVKVPGEFFNGISIYKVVPNNTQQVATAPQATIPPVAVPPVQPQMAAPQQPYVAPQQPPQTPIYNGAPQTPPVAPFPNQGFAGSAPTQPFGSQPTAQRLDPNGNPLPF